MDQLLLDVTGIPDLSDGMQITIVGEEDGKRITMEEIAAMTDTVHYEIMCVIGKRVPRVYRRGGKRYRRSWLCPPYGRIKGNWTYKKQSIPSKRKGCSVLGER